MQFIILINKDTRFKALYSLNKGTLEYIKGYYTYNALFATVYAYTNGTRFNIRIKMI